LAVQTGIHWRHWLSEPAAMMTAAEVLDEIAAATRDKTTPGK
jgi:hypothetical protein